MTVRTRSEVTVHEVDGVEVECLVGDSAPKLVVESNWVDGDGKVVVEFEGRRVVVLARDLVRAVDRASS